MSNEQLAMAFRKIAEGLYEAADVLFGTPEPATASGAVLARAVASEFPPFAPEDPEYEAIPLPAETPGLGRCPTHGMPWSVKGAGVSKAGKSYSSFWKCDGKTDGVFCDKKPTRAWADAHPIAA